MAHFILLPCPHLTRKKMKEIQNVTAIGVKMKLKRIETRNNRIETRNNRIENRNNLIEKEKSK